MVDYNLELEAKINSFSFQLFLSDFLKIID